MSIPIEDIVQVSVTSPAAPFEGININSLALFTESKAGNEDLFRFYTNASSVVSPSDYETNSSAARLANIIFSQERNIRTGNGYLAIVPMITSVDATSGSFLTVPIYGTQTINTAGKYQTIELSENFDNIKLVSDGYISLQVDELEVQNIVNMDFTSIDSLEAIANIFKDAFTGVDVSTDDSNNSIVLTSKTSGTTSQVKLIQTDPLPGTGTDLSTVDYFNVDAGIATQGTSVQVESLNDIKTVSDGILKIDVDGTIYNLTNLNFTSAVTVDNVIMILEQAFEDEEINVDIKKVNNSILLNSNITGSSSIIKLLLDSVTPGTDISQTQYLNANEGVIVQGEDATLAETLLEAMDRVKGKLNFSAIITDKQMLNAEIIDVAEVVQARKIFYFEAIGTISSIKKLRLEAAQRNQLKMARSLKGIAQERVMERIGDLSVAEAVKEAQLTYTRILYYEGTIAEQNAMKSATASLALSVNFEGTNTFQTLNLKRLTGVRPNSNITSSDKVLLDAAGADFYGSVGEVMGAPRYFSTPGNDYWDNVYGKRWLELEGQKRVFNLLSFTSTKIPQTNQGMSQVKAVLATVFDQGIINGLIGTNIGWQLPDRFGDLTRFDNAILSDGYYLYSQPISSQSYATRLKRQSPLIQCAATFAGAIHSVIIAIHVQY